MEFYGFDTETDNRKDGGQAVLLTIHGRNAGDSLVMPKKFDEIFDFLAFKGGRNYLAYNADFDIQAICHDNFIPYRVLMELGRFRVSSWRGYVFRYLPSKFLTVHKATRSFTVYDLKQFFGCSLNEASKKHLGSEKKDIPQSWYNRIKQKLKKGGVEKAKIIDYALHDAALAFKLGEKLCASYQKAGVEVKRLISPASMAVDYFRDDLEREPKPPLYLNRLWQKGFYGGRVEIGDMGTIKGVALYDIHSAYPSIINELVTLRGATMFDGFENDWDGRSYKKADYGLYFVTAYVPVAMKYGPLAVRDKMKVIYPVGAVKTWCGRHALLMLDRLKIGYRVHRWYEFGGSNGDKVFQGVDKLYKSRKDPVLSLAAKLTLNSLYGKLCENQTDRIRFGSGGYRSRDHFGRFTNYIFAVDITERIRCQTYLMALEHGGVMMATDSVLLPASEKIKTGGDLGEWDLKGVYSSATILGCGRYYLVKPDGSIEGYLRGFRGSGHYDKLKKCRRKFAKLKSLENLKMLQWANGRATGDLNVLNELQREIRLDDDKRFWPERPSRISDAFKRSYESKPWIIGKKEELENGNLTTC